MAFALTRTTLQEYAATPDDQFTGAFARIHELSRELYPALDARYGFAVAVLFNTLEDFKYGREVFPATLEDDQIEDFLAAQVIKSLVDVGEQV